MKLGIDGKLAVVTGAGKGIGRAIALELAREGLCIALVGRTEKPLKDLCSELSADGKPHKFFVTDLTIENAASKIAEEILHHFGSPDIVVHNAGGSLGVTEPLAGSVSWHRVWHFNVGVAVDMNASFIPTMLKKKWGRIVHISSASATTYAGYPAYVSAKAALNAYVRSMSRIFAKDNVILSAVSPGPMDSEGRYLSRLARENPEKMAEYCQHHLAIERLGQPDEISAAVAFLCSEHASFAAGSIFPVDGGTM